MFKFKNPFAKATCDKCGASYDPELYICPNCQDVKDPRKALGQIVADDYAVSPIRQIVIFFTLYIGLNLVATFITLLLSGNTYIDEITASMLVNYISYGVIFIAMIFILFPYLKPLFKSFINPKIFYGFLGLVAIILFNYAYNLAISGIDHSENINQSTLTVIVKAYPILSLIVVGFIGPFLEECAYRLGLFGFFKRINIILAYIIASLVFGLIHIHDWSSMNEWLSYPTYVISGLVMAILYDKIGFSASYLCHITNNIISIMSIILTTGAAS